MYGVTASRAKKKAGLNQTHNPGDPGAKAEARERPNEQPSTNVDSFKQESATILSFDTGPVNE